MCRNVFSYLIVIIQFCVIYAGLYNEKDNVFVLNDNNFDSNVVESNNSWIVEFYNSWCGHCIRFAPHWKNLANECTEWKELIVVAAIDCADKENTPICMHYEIEMYPTIYYFAAGQKSRPPKVKSVDADSVKKLKQEMIDFVTNQSLSNLNERQLRPFVPLRNLNVVEFNPDLKTVVITEKGASYVGREVILDLHGQLKLIDIRRILDDDNSTSSYLLESDGQLVLLARSEDKNDHLKEITSLLDKTQEDDLLKENSKLIVNKSENKNANSLQNEIRVDDPTINWRADSYMRLNENDLISSLLYSLRHEVPLKGHLGIHNVDIIYNHIQVLVKHLPIRDELISKLETLAKIIEEMKSQGDFKGMSGGGWLEIVDELFEKDKYPDEPNWTSCKGSASKFRGYPCSLWMTFHSVTVNAARSAKDEDCIEALLSIKNYINYFFGCQECRRNFMKGAVRMKSLVGSCNQATIFLWRSHNKANQRLGGDPSEDPSHPKTLFPNKYQCPTCHGRSIKTSISGMNDGWDEGEVLRFLGEMYGHESVALIGGSVNRHLTENGSTTSKDRSSKSDVFDGNRKLNKFKDGDAASLDVQLVKVERNVKQTSLMILFNQYDVGVCMVFYMSCIFLIVGLYLHFMKKKRMCRLKQHV